MAPTSMPAVFDQARAQLAPEMSLWESLTGDIDMRVSGQADQVWCAGSRAMWWVSQGFPV